jgi:hypothetical protein
MNSSIGGSHPASVCLRRWSTARGSTSPGTLEAVNLLRVSRTSSRSNFFFVFAIGAELFVGVAISNLNFLEVAASDLIFFAVEVAVGVSGSAFLFLMRDFGSTLGQGVPSCSSSLEREKIGVSIA